MEIRSKHALVTGAAKRIGRAIAESLLDAGARVSAHYLSSESEAAELSTRYGSSVVNTVQADLRSLTGALSLCEKATSAFGPIDILVNSASVYFPTPADSCAEEQWDELFDCNLKGVFFLSKNVHRTGSRGVIVNLVDVYARRAHAGYAPYCATKAGLLHLSRTLAKEWAPFWRVNSISPGPILFPPDYDKEKKEAAIERTLLKRAGKAEDIAAATLFMIENEYVTGTDLCVDGGRSIATF